MSRSGPSSPCRQPLSKNCLRALRQPKIADFFFSKPERALTTFVLISRQSADGRENHTTHSASLYPLRLRTIHRAQKGLRFHGSARRTAVDGKRQDARS